MIFNCMLGHTTTGELLGMRLAYSTDKKGEDQFPL